MDNYFKEKTKLAIRYLRKQGLEWLEIGSILDMEFKEFEDLFTGKEMIEMEDSDESSDTLSD